MYRYGGAAADAVIRMKYGQMAVLGRAMGREMARIAERMERPELICPVPLHKRKLRQRGFNQSAIMAREIAGILAVPMDTSFLFRVRDTSPQAGLSREERLSNIRGAFQVRRPSRVASKRILLVDDIVTTGTTIKEASRVLMRSKAKVVDVVAFARVG